jgi:hypothetical protein
MRNEMFVIFITRYRDSSNETQNVQENLPFVYDVDSSVLYQLVAFLVNAELSNKATQLD